MTPYGGAARHAPRSCPVCGDALTLTRLGCQSCGTELSGMFEACQFCALAGEDRQLLAAFLQSRGNMKELERHLGVSYPTARARFDAVLGRLGLGEPGAGTSEADEEGEGALAVLTRLAQGEIDVDQAEVLL